LTTEECNLQRPGATRRDIGIALETTAAVVQGEASLLAALLRNLIDNAVRYSPHGSHVKVAVHTNEQGRVEISVTDDGPGIAAEERERIFERFYRVLGNDATGSGLGLSIVHRVATLHGASVRIREGASGRGTCFVVTFPARKTHDLMR
jgi:signal transduction histidine kinase